MPGADSWNYLRFRVMDFHPCQASASSLSPEWRGCGPGWTEWSCPCTAADICWCPPAPSGLPLTVEKHVHKTLLNMTKSNIYRYYPKMLARKGPFILFFRFGDPENILHLMCDAICFLKVAAVSAIGNVSMSYTWTTWLDFTFFLVYLLVTTTQNC